VEHAFKYHGLGNDFVLLDRRQSRRDIDPDTARRLCDRRLGLGADGVLVLLPDFGTQTRMVVHNADGSIAEMCGNGIHCAAKYLAERAPERSDLLRLATGEGSYECRLSWTPQGTVEQVEVEMGVAQVRFLEQPLEGFPGLVASAVTVGNPHLVLFDRPLEDADVFGARLEQHPAFPERTNVEWAAVDGQAFRVRVWERGVGLTLACGSGACAVAAVAVRTGRAAAGQWLKVHLPGGALEVRVSDGTPRLQMRGPATFVFEATVPDLP